MPDRYVIRVTRVTDDETTAIDVYSQTTEDASVVRRVVAAVNVRLRRRKGKGDGDG